jgi:two-component system, NarL family, response regulator LiaR
MDSPIRILVVDDHAVVRQGILRMLEPWEDLLLVGEAVDGFEALEKVRELIPDVILMDLVMPRMGGIEAIHKIRREFSGARILVLTSFSDDDQVLPALKAGAIGYVLKGSNPDELLRSIRDVYHGDYTLSPAVTLKLMKSITEGSRDVPNPDPLTDRELDVLKLIGRGLSNTDISEILHVGEGTIRSHVKHIMDKLNLENRTQAALYALREGLTTLFPGK